MYIPKYSEITDREFLKSFIIEQGFGTMVTMRAGAPSAGHYPFLIEDEAGELVLWTHLAKSNPQWLDTGDCLVIFTGPHAYVSPTAYVNPLNVPTWNYSAVHINCRPEIVSDGAGLMRKLVHHYEERNGTAWPYELPEDFHQRLMNSIVWLKLNVKSIEGKFKLSQNRDKQDYEGVLKALAEKPSDNNRELLRYMQLTRPDKLR